MLAIINSRCTRPDVEWFRDANGLPRPGFVDPAPYRPSPPLTDAELAGTPPDVIRMGLALGYLSLGQVERGRGYAPPEAEAQAA